MEDNRVFNLKPLQEMLDYANDKSLEIKVNRIFWKCIKSGRIGLSDKIKEKYSHLIRGRNTDSAMAFAMALMADKMKDK